MYCSTIADDMVFLIASSSALFLTCSTMAAIFVPKLLVPDPATNRKNQQETEPSKSECSSTAVSRTTGEVSVSADFQDLPHLRYSKVGVPSILHMHFTLGSGPTYGFHGAFTEKKWLAVSTKAASSISADPSICRSVE